MSPSIYTISYSREVCVDKNTVADTNTQVIDNNKEVIHNPHKRLILLDRKSWPALLIKIKSNTLNLLRNIKRHGSTSDKNNTLLMSLHSFKSY